MARKPDKPWQFKVSFGLVGLVALLVLGYFYQSFLTVRAIKPVEVAIERIGSKGVENQIQNSAETSRTASRATESAKP